jgi:hypothetical protein
MLGRNWWPTVPGVLDLNSSPTPFHRASGRSWSLDIRHNRYSYVTAGAITGFDAEAMGLKPPWLQLRIPWWYAPCSPRGYA